MFGVIGLGGMGRHHARVYHELGVLGAVYDVDSVKTEEFAERYQIYGPKSLKELLEIDTIEGFSIATPTPTHFDIVSKCVSNGYRTLCEKPLAPTLQEAKKMIGLIQGKPDVLSVGYIEKFNPIFNKVLQLQKRMGELTSVNIKRVGGIPRSADNVVLDLMTHDFNLLLNLFGKQPEHIYAQTHYRDNILDSAQTFLDFGSASATCEANWLTPIKVRNLQLTGTKAYCEVNLIKQSLTLFTGKEIETITCDEEPLKRELVAFIQKDQKQMVSAQEAYDTLALTLKALEE